MTQHPARRSVLLAGAALLTGCSVSTPSDTKAPPAPAATPAMPSIGEEEFRPQYHYTSERHQINDPNGLLWYAGEYHLFHQYNIDGAVHWGHAVSTDFLRWERLEPALYPDEIGNIWSGSAVVDERNTSGLQDGDEKVLVAIFTYSEHPDGKQSQGLAYSNDKGRTWTKHPANPIVPNTGQKDFRDPKVFWHQDSGKWIMVVSMGDHLQFHTSANLIEWARSGTFGHDHGAHGGAWECPDLFQLPVQGTQEHRWVLSVSITDGAPAGGSGMQYFIGDFDGDTFHNENTPDTTLWQNFGKDYYAGVTWGDRPFPDDRRLMIAWTDNWQYRENVPTDPFNGQLSLVRELQLRRYEDGIRLIQNPAAEYTQLRQWLGTWSSETIIMDNNLLRHVDGDCLEISMTVDVGSSTCSEVGIDLRTGSGHRTRVGYNLKKEKLFVDRTKSGKVPERDGKDIGDSWASTYEASLKPENGRITLRILLDRSSLEVFGNEREQISTLILPSRENTGLATYADGEAKIEHLTLHKMTGIHR